MQRFKPKPTQRFKRKTSKFWNIRPRREQPQFGVCMQNLTQDRSTPKNKMDKNPIEECEVPNVCPLKLSKRRIIRWDHLYTDHEIDILHREVRVYSVFSLLYALRVDILQKWRAQKWMWYTSKPGFWSVSHSLWSISRGGDVANQMSRFTTCRYRKSNKKRTTTFHADNK